MIIGNIKKELLRSFNETYQISPPLQEDQVVFSDPFIVNEKGCNTRVRITSREYTGFIYYNRYPISSYLRGFHLPAYNGYFKDLHEMLQFLNEAWNLPLLTADFDNGSLTNSLVILSPKANSLYFTPGSSIALSYLN